MVNEDLREKFGMYAKVWLTLAGRPEFSPNPNMADFGITKEGLEKIIKKSAEQAIRGLLKTLGKTCIAVTPAEISQKDFRNIISEKSADVKDTRVVSYNFGAGAFRIEEYQPEGTRTDRIYRISANLANECNLCFDFIESGRFKIEDEGAELNIYHPQNSEKRLGIENLALKEIPEVLFALLYEPKSFVQVKKTDITESS